MGSTISGLPVNQATGSLRLSAHSRASVVLP
jgi:hypothetical protein